MRLHSTAAAPQEATPDATTAVLGTQGLLRQQLDAVRWEATAPVPCNSNYQTERFVQFLASRESQLLMDCYS